MGLHGDGRDRKERVELLEVIGKNGFMVDLRRLRALRAVADHGTLAAAADAALRRRGCRAAARSSATSSGRS
jgi:hypothetical protein